MTLTEEQAKIINQAGLGVRIEKEEPKQADDE